VKEIETQHRIELRIFPQDPKSPLDPVPVKVLGNLLPGPIGSRIAVFDYNRDRDEVYQAAEPGEDGSFPEYDASDLRFHQLNAYAIAARAIELVELELGRDLQWGFDASRLILLPHAGYLENAFYSEDTHSLQFYSFLPAGSSEVFHTSLSHDIVAHEVGHAILDSVRDRFTEGLHMETAALHEAVGDLTSVFAGMSHEVIIEQIASNLSKPNLISSIAEHFYGDDHPLRDLLHEPMPESFWEKSISPHSRSLRLTWAVYRALHSMQKNRIDAGMDNVAALRLALRALQRMVVRGIDYLPPADGTFADYAQGILKADEFANPDDRLGFRNLVASAFMDHGVLAGRTGVQSGLVSDRAWPNLPSTWPNITRGDAYQFLDQNRSKLRLSRQGQYRDFVVRELHTTVPPSDRFRKPAEKEGMRGSAPGAHGRGDPEQVIIVYDYPVEVELKGRSFGLAEGQWLSIWGGGTLVFDPRGRLRHHAAKPVTKDRVRQTLDFVKSGIARGFVGQMRSAVHKELRMTRNLEPWILSLEADEAVLRSNATARCYPHTMINGEA
jgi:hypothetical protein